VDYWLNPIGVCNKVVAGAIEDHTLAVISWIWIIVLCISVSIRRGHTIWILI
jgi:hypothetical protein